MSASQWESLRLVFRARLAWLALKELGVLPSDQEEPTALELDILIRKDIQDTQDGFDLLKDLESIRERFD